MRRLLFTIFTILFLLCGCSLQPVPLAQESSKTNVAAQAKTSDESAASFDPALKKRKENIVLLLNSKVPFDDIAVTSTDDIYNIGVTIIGSQEVTEFGNHIINTMAAFESEFADAERGYIFISLKDDNLKAMLSFHTSHETTEAKEYGIYTDMRSGEPKSTTLSSVEDMYKIFPTASQNVAKAGIDQKERAMYEEIMGILDRDFSRSEDEILKEIAPKYGMTAPELKKFLSDMLEKIY